jgi:ABC-type transport system involved in multi-copper enzyme maturation permease subunit
MNATIILAKATFREAVRRRIVLAGLVLGICFLIIFSVGFHMITGSIQNAAANIRTPANANVNNIARVEGTNVLLLAGLYAVTFLSIAMGALLGADTLAGEINSGAIQSIVSKPIRRADVVVGKWLGFAFLLALYIGMLAGGTYLSVLAQSGYNAPHFLAGLGLIYLESLVIMTVSILCSSALSALATGGIVFGLYGLAFIGGWVEQFGSILQSPTAVKVGIVTSLIIPSESLWRRAAYEMQSPISGVLGISPFGTTSVPSLLMIVYAVIYLGLSLFMAIRVFQKRDL